MIKGAFVPACGGREAVVYGATSFPCALQSGMSWKKTGYRAYVLRGAGDMARSVTRPWAAQESTCSYPCKALGPGHFLLSSHHFSMHNMQGRSKMLGSKTNARSTSKPSAPPPATKCRRVSTAALHSTCPLSFQTSQSCFSGNQSLSDVVRAAGHSRACAFCERRLPTMHASCPSSYYSKQVLVLVICSLQHERASVCTAGCSSSTGTL